MIFSQTKLQIFLIISIGFVYCGQARQPTPTPQRVVKYETISDKQFKIEPGQMLQISFNSDVYDVQSIKVLQKLNNGTLQDMTINNYQLFEDQDKFNLGGCVSYQTQANYQKLFTINVNLNIDSDQVQARFTDVLYFKDDKTFMMLSSDFNIYTYTYLSLGNSQNGNYDTLQSSVNFKNLINIKPDQEPWAKGISYKSKGYIFTPSRAFLINSYQVSNIKSDMIIQTNYVARQKIYSIVTCLTGNSIYILTASGTDGVDSYYVQQTGEFIYSASYQKQQQNNMANINQNMPATCMFNIVKIKIVQQGQDQIAIFQENNEGLHVLLINPPKSQNAPITFQYQYFIGIPFISSFDAVKYTMSITLGSKTFQSGLEVFFDKNNYYINYFGDDEIQIDDVVLDSQTKNAIWISDDIGKAYRHSIFRQNFQYRQQIYEEFIDLAGDNQVIFFNYQNMNLLFTLGQRWLEIFNITNVQSEVLCSSKQGGVDQQYNVTFTTNYCSTEQLLQGKEADSLYLFKECIVSFNLNFQTIDVYITSANIGLIIGLTIGLFVLLVIILLCIYNRYKKNRGQIDQLFEQKKKYMNIESDEHNNMRQNEQKNQIQHQFDIQ
ncbi:transmembrane protein, putative (macronuclear) [Tetrahymena thermophila SB210]|uniref:Transmembrane protein, putative n=1 Tax=Tetrahymena thermophila (strain SB210) TaxID=312017 RepID=Q22CV8_TETTS|nr:transmembrane protein, putative [Tetrahymena thermophila SB210]EAR83161.2 transmembrane protein, putative [Tetrahymena thermophila SB210]|eukprot:XP_001030824.2 transmembrane protein, putative [Tetrahymena thermophila SB210]